MKNLFFILLVLLIWSCGDGKKLNSSQEMQSNEKTYKNPVIDKDFPDPTVLQAPDGKFYVYATNSGVDGQTHNMQVRKSDDLVHWEVLPDALPEKPSWAEIDFWAPHVFYDQDQQKYFMHYSGESKDPDIGKCLGIATSDSPEGPFVDKGEPLLCGETFINIDPMVFEDSASGKSYLYWGSGHESLKVRELSEDGLNFKRGSQIVELVKPVFDHGEHSYEDLVEGVWVLKKGNFYYLFYSGDNCCGQEAHYATMVARSKSPTGPFEKYKGGPEETSVILRSNSRWKAPGHNSVIQDEVGDFWMVYHAIDTKEPGAGRKMLIDRIDWKDGWPIIPGGTPSIGENSAPQIE